MKQIPILVTVFFICQFQLFSQTIARYPYGSLSPDLVASNVTATNISLGNGINQVACSSFVIGSGFDQTTEVNALNNGDYFEFTITPNPGYSITINTVSILSTGSNLVGTPLLSRTLFYKKQSQAFYTYVAGYNSTSLGANICSNNSSGSILSPNVVTTEPITFRLVYYNNTSGVQARIGIVTVSGIIALPIKLSSFAASNVKNNNILNFTTTSEINNTGFEIERSSDGNEFKNIGWLDGVGNSTEENQYQFIDGSPLLGMNYYRLKQFDLDGKFEYSEIVSTALNPTELHFVQNYASSEINVLGIEGVGDFNIYSGGGQLIKSGSNLDNTIDISELREGLYTLSMSHQGQIISHKFVKL